MSRGHAPEAQATEEASEYAPATSVRKKSASPNENDAAFLQEQYRVNAADVAEACASAKANWNAEDDAAENAQPPALPPPDTFEVHLADVSTVTCTSVLI